MLQIKRVILKGASASSRRGAYFRVYDTETKRKSYYKVSAKVRSKASAESKFHVAQQHKLNEPEESISTEDATLHFRLDYNVGDARAGHVFQMRDSHITAKIPKSMTDDDARKYLGNLFREAFSNEFGGELANMTEEELVEGLERGTGNSTGIKIRYRYGEGRDWKKADATVGDVYDIIHDKEEFFYKTVKRKRKK